MSDKKSSRGLCVIVIAMLWGCCSLIAEPLMLVDGGKPLASIVVDDKAIDAEKTAAKELQKYIKEISGVDLPIVNQPTDSVNVLVGQSKLTAKLLARTSWKSLGMDGIVIKTSGRNLILAGGRPRGSLYAVYTFLKDQLGCRWYAPDETKMPKNKTIQIAEIDTVYRPKFEFRQYFTECKPLFDVKLRRNGRTWAAIIPKEFGGQAVMGEGHTLPREFLKKENYFENHPEWYSFRKEENKRVPRLLCLTNIEAQKQVVVEVLKYLETEYPKWDGYSKKIVSISCDDTNLSCQCPLCLALVKKQGSESAPLLKMANYVARAVKKKYPDVLINVLAYWHTDKPPRKMKLEDNVMILLGVLDRNHKHGIAKTGFGQYVKKWGKMTNGKVYIWDYDAHFNNFMQPHPNHYVPAKSLRFYADHGVSGVLIQGSWGSTGEFVRMRNWVNAQLLWNPYLPVKPLMKEFLNAYYGKAGKFMLNYIDLISHAVNRKKGEWLGVYSATTKNWFTLKDINIATRLFDKALEAVKGDEKMTYRVRRAKLAIDIVWLERYYEFKKESKRTRLPFLGPKDPFAEVDRIEKNEFESSTYREWAPFDAYVEKLRKLFPKKTGKLPAQTSSLAPGEWFDIQQDQLSVTPKECGKICEDPKASNGKSLLLQGDPVELRGHYTVPDHLAGRWDVYVVLRAESATDEPVGVGVKLHYREYPTAKLFEAFRETIFFTQAESGEYKTVGLGTYNLKPGTIILVEPNEKGSVGECSKTFIDRVFLTEPVEN